MIKALEMQKIKLYTIKDDRLLAPRQVVKSSSHKNSDSQPNSTINNKSLHVNQFHPYPYNNSIYNSNQLFSINQRSIDLSSSSNKIPYVQSFRKPEKNIVKKELVVRIKKGEKFCRTCMKDAKKNDPLISPCNCNGVEKYIHESCFKNHLRNSGVNINNEKAMREAKCDICKGKFNIKVVKKKNFLVFSCVLFSVFYFMFTILLLLLWSFFSQIVLNALIKKKYLEAEKKNYFHIASYGLYFLLDIILLFVLTMLLKSRFYEEVTEIKEIEQEISEHI